MNELRYAETHEWVRRESEDRISVGISDHAQEELGDIVYIELPSVGTAFRRGDEVAVIESTKTGRWSECCSHDATGYTTTTSRGSASTSGDVSSASNTMIQQAGAMIAARYDRQPRTGR